jgi:GntR family transcriptional repressor for pyruvate dehydrogenase complex
MFTAMKRQDTGPDIRRSHPEIVAEIQTLIRRDGLKPGDRLPSERALAATFGISRNSVREAIRALIEKGVLVSRRGDGTYLASNDVNALVDELSGAVARRRQRLKEIFEFRRLLEPEIAACAADRIRPEDLDFLKLTVFEQERRMLAGEDESQQDRTFHLRLAQATGNRVVHEVVHILEGIVGESRARISKNLSRQLAAVRAHKRIIEFLQRGDAENARQAMIDHLAEMAAAMLGGANGNENR